MISTLTPCAAAPLGVTAGSIAMERQSVTAPDYRSVHGTGLPVAATFAADQLAARSKTVVVAVPTNADVQGSPPRGAPV